MLNNLIEAISWIESQLKFKPKTDLDRMKKAYEMLDLNLSKVKKIHVAGTNGKGSVCAYLSEILIEEGYKVGTYTSPYLLKFNERIKLQFQNIPDDDLYQLILSIYDFNLNFEKVYGEFLSFFELLTLMALIYFHQQQVDVMVMEVGLGGLLDATNVLNYDLSIITSIGFDHMKQLGNTLESIAYNKLGILKDKNHLISTVDSKLHDQFMTYALRVGATYELYTQKDITKVSDQPLSFIYKGEIYALNLLGDYQMLNAVCAISGIHYLYPDIKEEVIKKGLIQTSWPGRLELIDTNMYLDGAHNEHAMKALSVLSKTIFKDKKMTVIFSALADKDVQTMLKIIKSFADQIILTSFDDPRYLSLSEFADENIIYIENPKEAILYAQKTKEKDDIILLTGSLHFAGFIKKMYR